MPSIVKKLTVIAFIYKKLFTSLIFKFNFSISRFSKKKKSVIFPLSWYFQNKVYSKKN